MTNIRFNSNNDVIRFLVEHNLDQQKVRAEVFLDAISKFGDENAKDVAEFVKVSNKSSEILSLLDFALASICHRPFPIREITYDRGLDGIREINQYFIDKRMKTQVEKIRAEACNWLHWFFLRIPTKQELIKMKLLYLTTDVSVVK